MSSSQHVCTHADVHGVFLYVCVSVYPSVCVNSGNCKDQILALVFPGIQETRSSC